MVWLCRSERFQGKIKVSFIAEGINKPEWMCPCVSELPKILAIVTVSGNPAACDERHQLLLWEGMESDVSRIFENIQSILAIRASET